jgi:catechol 2,3-dioxygenase-like lactoylglutathione lyase family enzyme
MKFSIFSPESILNQSGTYEPPIRLYYKSDAMKKFPSKEMQMTNILVVNNLPASVQFYRDVLGAKLFREYGGTSAVFDFLGNWLLLVTAGGPTEDKPGVNFIPLPDENNISQSFTIRVKNCQESHDILKSRGATFLTPPHRWEYETRCFFRDPDGYLWEISEVPST